MEEEKVSQKSILKATSIVGGSQVIIIIIGLIKTKSIAVLLGPAGIGINGILQNTVDLVRQATGFGINFSGVKEIAASSATGDLTKVGRTITVLRRWALYTGMFGMLTALILSTPLSYYAFDTDKYSLSIALVSVTLLITSISSGQLALLQGMRQIKQMAKVSVYGTLFSVLLTLPLYWWLGTDGIVPGIVISSIIALVISYLFTSKIVVIKPTLTLKQTFNEGLGMARLGFFIVITGLVVSATLYAIRSIVAQKLNIEAVGCFFAVWTISTTYINIILSSMLSDFFPRLAEIEVYRDNARSNNLINEQLDMALVIASPLIIFLIAAANLVITLLFSPAFLMGMPVLQWQLLAGFLAIISWALGVMFLAKNKGVFALYTEGIWSLVYYTFVLITWDTFGFISLGVGCLVAHLVKILGVYIITNKLGNFTFNYMAAKTILCYGVLVLAVFINVMTFTGIIQYFISFLVFMLSFVMSFKRISKIIDLKKFIKSK